MLKKLVDLLDTINEDELSFMYKAEQQRVYNLLMAVVVNDKRKSSNVCQSLGQGFNRLISSAQEDYFAELGIPEEWSVSETATTLTADVFNEQMREFEEADVGLKWQWFVDIDLADSFFFSEACGLYVSKIDIRQGQTPQA